MYTYCILANEKPFFGRQSAMIFSLRMPRTTLQYSGLPSVRRDTYRWAYMFISTFTGSTNCFTICKWTNCAHTGWIICKVYTCICTLLEIKYTHNTGMWSCGWRACRNYLTLLFTPTPSQLSCTSTYPSIHSATKGLDFIQILRISMCKKWVRRITRIFLTTLAWLV